MNSWRHSDSSTVRTRLLRHRLCLWNAHHPWTRYILFPSAQSWLHSCLVMANKCPERRKIPNEILLKYFCDLCRLFTTESQVTELPGAAENLSHRKKHRGTIASKWRSTNHSSSFFSNKSVPLIGDLRNVERASPHLVPGNQCLGTGTKWWCVHTLSTWYETVHSYSILPCQTPFWNMTWAYQRVQTEVVPCPRTNKNNVHTVTRYPLLYDGILLWVVEKRICSH